MNSPWNASTERRGRRILHPGFLLAAILASGGASGAGEDVDTPDRPATARGIEINYRLPRKSRVSLAIYDEAGHQKRTLAAGQELSAGPHVALWDGLDRNGAPAPPGRYTWKLLANQGLEADLVTVLGVNPKAVSVEANPGPQPWSWWVGNHSGPTAVAVGGEGFYVGAATAEGPLTLVLSAEDGINHRWSVDAHEILRHASIGQSGREDIGWGPFGPIALAEVGPHLVTLTSNGRLFKRDAVSGRVVRDAFASAASPTGRMPILDVYGAPAVNPVQRGTVSMDMDADEGQIVVSSRFPILHGDGTVIAPASVRWYDFSGRLLRTLPLNEPGALALGPAGVTFVISNGLVVSLDAVDRMELFPGADIHQPTALAYDRVNHQLLVANGAPDWRILRFRLDGTRAAAYGAYGGRRNGPFVRQAFRRVLDLACDRAGGFYVAEAGLRRISYVNAAGELTLERLGGLPYYAGASATPDCPTDVWVNQSEDTLVCYEVRYDTDDDLGDSGSWRLKSVYELPAHWPLRNLEGPLPLWRVTRWNGGIYFVHEAALEVMRLDEASQELKPVAYAGRLGLPTGRGADAWNCANPNIRAAAATAGLLAFDPMECCGSITWSDSNGNGQFDPTEFRFAPTGQFTPWINKAHFDLNLNLILGHQVKDMLGFGVCGGEPFPVVSSFDYQDSAYATLFNHAPPGAVAPEWDWNRIERSAAKLPFDVDDRRAATAVRRDEAGNVYLLMRNTTGTEAVDRHELSNSNGPANDVLRCSLMKADRTGISWEVSKHRSYGPQAPYGANPAAQFGSPLYFPGAVKNCLIVCDAHFFGATAWTHDGLYAGFFLDRHVEDGTPRENYFPDGTTGTSATFPRGDDYQAGGSVLETDDGRVLWFAPGNNCVAVYRIRGWDDWHRDTGVIHVTHPHPAPSKTGTGLRAEFFANPTLSGAPVASRISPGVWAVNGAGLSDIYGRWENWVDGPVPGELGPGIPFSARWTGQLVAPHTEPFWFRLYNAFNTANDANAGRVRFKLNGVTLIDNWPGRSAGQPWESGPVPLHAGQSYDLQLEFTHPTGLGAQLSLVWSSDTLEWIRVAHPYLLPGAASSLLPKVTVNAIDPDASESGEEPAVFQFRLAGPPLTEDLEVHYRLHGTVRSSDYWPVSGRVIIPRGELAANVAIRPMDDSVLESAEQLLVTIGFSAHYLASNGGDVATATVQDNDDALPFSPVAYYPLDESSGLTIPNQTRVAYHGNMQEFNGGLPVPRARWDLGGGKYHGALHFPTGAEGIHFPRLPALARHFTISFWLKTPSSNLGLLKLTAPGSPDYHELVLGVVDGKLSAFYSGLFLQDVGPSMLSDDQWHHVTYVWIGAEAGSEGAHLLYVDGAFRNAGGNFIPPTEAGRILQVGGFGLTFPARGILNLVGKLDDLRVYDRALTSGQVAMLSGLETGPAPYARWAGAAGLVDAAALPDADPEGDTVVNLAEFAFGGNPAVPDAAELRPTVAMVCVGEELSVCVTNRRAVSAGVSVRIEWSLDLVLWSDASEIPGFFQETLPTGEAPAEVRACFPVRSRTSAFVRVVLEAEVAP